jgi:uncharacterized protein (DUF1810 family)
MGNSFDLRRFVDAQAPVYAQVVEELSRGRKRTLWTWFVFPQLAGLGFSAMAQRFAIGSRAEAIAYFGHDLGPAWSNAPALSWRRAKRPSMKSWDPGRHEFRSSMTLFDGVSKQEIFAEAIAMFYPVGKDPATIDILRSLEN